MNTGSHFVHQILDDLNGTAAPFNDLNGLNALCPQKWFDFSDFTKHHDPSSFDNQYGGYNAFNQHDIKQEPLPLLPGNGSGLQPGFFDPTAGNAVVKLEYQEITSKQIDYFPSKCTKCAQLFEHHSDFVSHTCNGEGGSVDAEHAVTEQSASSSSSPPPQPPPATDADVETEDLPSPQPGGPGGNKNFKCSYCDKPFKRKRDKTNHERIHTGEKPYKCLHCSKAFSQIGAKNRHEHTHLEQKQYACPYYLQCDKTFKRRADLLTHTRRHCENESHRCLRCGKTFAYTGSFCNHSIMHANEANESSASSDQPAVDT